MRFKSRTMPYLLVACILGLGGCATYSHPYYTQGPVISDISVAYIHTAPPPPRRVHIPTRPSMTAVWIDGYWNWTGVRFVWVDGYWERNARGRTWMPGNWVQTKRGWYRRPGRWK